MKVLVTGAGGFIGSHLVENLKGAGHDVKAFVRYNSKGSSGWLDKSPVKKGIEVHAGDIRDFDSVSSAMKDMEFVFHLAALIGIPYSYESPLAYVKTNVEGTYNVLQAARLNEIQRVVHTSTSEVYGTAQCVPIDEKHPVNPQSPYAATKSGADWLAVSFSRSFGLPVTVARPFNAFGPRQSARAVIPTIITQILSGNRTLRLGNLTPTRDFNYVLDTVEGITTVGTHEKTEGQTINIGSGRETSIGELAERIAGIMDAEVEIEQDESRVRSENSEVERLLCDASKAKELTGWEPRFDLDRGLSETIDWLRDNLDLYEPNSYSV